MGATLEDGAPERRVGVDDGRRKGRVLAEVNLVEVGLRPEFAPCEVRVTVEATLLVVRRGGERRPRERRDL